MDYRANTAGTTREIRFSGRMTFADNEVFRRVLDEFGEGGTTGVALDLGGLDFLDSAGLGMLLLAKETAGERNLRLMVRGARGQVQKMLDLAHFKELLDIE